MSDKVFKITDYSFPKHSNDVTVAHLLTHTSGIPDYYPDDECDGEHAPEIKFPWSYLIETRGLF